MTEAEHLNHNIQNWIKGKEYNAGDIVIHKGVLWECTWNNNAREPSELALGWKKK